MPYNKEVFWKEFIDYCKDNNGVFAGNSPVEHSYIGKAVDSSCGVCLWAVIGIKFARVEVYINSGSRELNKKIFDFLYSQKNIIEEQYGLPLEWQRLTDKIVCRIKDQREYACVDSQNKMEIFKFMLIASNTLFTIFREQMRIYTAMNL